MKFSAFTICSLLLFKNIQIGRSACDPPTLCHYNGDLCFACLFYNRPPEDVCRLDIIEDGKSSGISDAGYSYNGDVCSFYLSLNRLEDGLTQYAVVVAKENDYTSTPLVTLGRWYVQKLRKFNNTPPTLEMSELSSESSQSETRHFTVKCEMLDTAVWLDCPGQLAEGSETSVSIKFTLEKRQTETCHCQASSVYQISLSDGNSQIIFVTFKRISVSSCNATTYGVNCDQTCTCVAEHTAHCHKNHGTCTCKPGFTGSNCQSGMSCQNLYLYMTCQHLYIYRYLVAFRE